MMKSAVIEPKLSVCVISKGEWRRSQEGCPYVQIV